MIKPRKTLLLAATVAAVAAGGTAIAVAGGGDDAADTPIPAGDRDRAGAVALDYVGDGRVTGTEVGDEESYYEVEVTRPDGSQVDVQLDRALKVVSSKADDDGAEQTGQQGD
jgi:uncharacterized membrane protein YkoI